jgi:uncharacterized cupin superfamily protein
MVITHIAQTAAITDLPHVGPVAKPLSEPACELHMRKLVLEGTSSPGQGIWECSPGKFRRDIKFAEFMHILSGKGTFTPDVGDPIAFAAGDTIMMSPQTNGVWDIEQTVRKVYVLIPASDA